MQEMRLTNLSRIDREYPITHVTNNLEVALNAITSDGAKRALTVTTDGNITTHQEIDAKIEEDMMAKAIYEKALVDKEYCRSLIGYIVSEGLIVAHVAHREKDLGKETTKNLFNAKIDEVLNPYYIRLLALRFEKTRGKEQTKKHSR